MKDHSRTAIITASAAVAVVFLLAPARRIRTVRTRKRRKRGPLQQGQRHRPGPRKQRPDPHPVRPPGEARRTRSTSATSTTSRSFRPTRRASPWSRTIRRRKRQDAWVIDVATGKGTRITNASQRRELTRAPVWSPDGKQLAYVSLRAGTEGLYRKASNGEGPEELLYKHRRLRDEPHGMVAGRPLPELFHHRPFRRNPVPAAARGRRGAQSRSKPSAAPSHGAGRAPFSRQPFSLLHVESIRPARNVRPAGRSLGQRSRERRTHGRYPPTAAWAWVSGGRMAKSSTTWPPTGDSWRST